MSTANELQRDLVAKIEQEQSQSHHGKVHFLSVYGPTAIVVKELKKIATLKFPVCWKAKSVIDS
jgi:hypothetical protein